MFKLLPVSYVMVIAFCLKFKNFIVISFNQTFEKLSDVSNLAGEMLHYFEMVTTRQFKDCAKFACEKKERHLLSEMFSCELKLVIDILENGLAKSFSKDSKS